MSVFSLIGVRIFWLANKDLNLCILILKSLNISNVGNLVGGLYSLPLTMYSFFFLFCYFLKNGFFLDSANQDLG